MKTHNRNAAAASLTAITAEDVSLYLQGYPQTVTPENAGQMWASLKVEMACSRFAQRTGLPRSEVSVVVNSKTKKAYPQWVHAIPKALPVINEIKPEKT